MWKGPLKKISQYKWMIPKGYKPCMKVPGIIFADEEIMNMARRDNTPDQVANVACLPGIVRAALAMPDLHWGYGMPIGGVAATVYPSGVISPGGVGVDINCGVRLLRTNLKKKDIQKVLPEIMDSLFREVPCGVGVGGPLKLSRKELRKVLEKGVIWAVEQGFGWPEDPERVEEHGAMEGANPDAVSDVAYQRGQPQLGSLGAGNHFLEVQYVEEIFDERIASAFGIENDMVTVMIHTGSRGFGHQIAEEHVRLMQRVMAKYGITLPDRQLASAPLDSPEGKKYFGAMVCAANFAWTNRQIITHFVRRAFEKVFGTSARELGMYIVYDVAHNIAKIEEHEVDGKLVKLCVHRKGATRAFPAGHPALPEIYRDVGQPVIIPGDMGTTSYVLVGTQQAMEETFGTTCHGAGRVMSRAEAKRRIRARDLISELASQGIIVRAASYATVSEEAPEAYKDVDRVVDVVEKVGIARKVAKLKPLGVIKG